MGVCRHPPLENFKNVVHFRTLSRNSFKSFSINLEATFVLFSKPLTLLPVIFFLITKKMGGGRGARLLPPPPFKTIKATPLVRLVNSKVKSGGGGEGRKRV